MESGMKEVRAQEQAIKYAERQHRYRAYNIARTELSFAYNQGSYQGVKQAREQEQGYLTRPVKVWCTADDERVCPVCGALDGMKIGIAVFNTSLYCERRNHEQAQKHEADQR